MKCSVHPEKEAVGQCPECGAALCNDCYNHTNLHYCPDCVATDLAFNKKTRNSCLVMGIIFAALFAFILGASLSESGVGAAIGMGIYGAMGGFAFGNALFASRGTKKHWVTVLVMALIDLILGFIFFFIQLVALIKLQKVIKTETELLATWPN